MKRKFSLIFLFLSCSSHNYNPSTDLAEKYSLFQRNFFVKKSDNKIMTSSDISSTLDYFRKKYGNISSSWGYDLEIKVKPDSLLANSFSNRQNKKWKVELHQGLLELHGFSKSNLATAICQNLGYFFGGFPFDKSFMAFGGNADYWTSYICLPAYFKDHPSETKNNFFIKEADVNIRADVCRNYSKDQDNSICKAVVKSTFEVLEFYRMQFGLSSLKVSDISESVAQKYPKSELPAIQCRMDTFIAGALCKNGSKWKVNATYPLTQKDMKKYSCDSADTKNLVAGVRPDCWYITTEVNP